MKDRINLLFVFQIILSSLISCDLQDGNNCGFYEVGGEQRKLNIGSNGGCYYLTPSGNKSYVDRDLCYCEDSNDNLETSIIIDKGIYIVSYNEVYQQPNWVEYVVSNRPKNVDRGSMDFYKEDGISTSDDYDYSNNKWDKGHLAPAASFSDSYSNLRTTFSFLNCALQVDNLNRGEWAELEQQVRDWSVSSGNITVRVELVFSDGHTVLPTDAHVPTGFWKNLTFMDGSTRCYYFPNSNTTANWTAYEQNCN
jgi:DNA/RNA endonuclease G (NUC1)